MAIVSIELTVLLLKPVFLIISTGRNGLLSNFIISKITLAFPLHMMRCKPKLFEDEPVLAISTGCLYGASSPLESSSIAFLIPGITFSISSDLALYSVAAPSICIKYSDNDSQSIILSNTIPNLDQFKNTLGIAKKTNCRKIILEHRNL